MNCLRKLLPSSVAALIAAAMLGAPMQARADFIIRATDLNSNNTVNVSVTQSAPSLPDGSGFMTFSSAVGNYVITVVTHISTTGPGITSASDTINIRYNGATGVNSHSLLIESLSNMFTNPTSPPNVTISSNGSPSTSGLSASSIIMTSGVLSGNVIALGAAGTTLGGQLGQTTGTGSMGSASSVLLPNPAGGASFAISTPFSFYQTYTFSGFNNSNQSGSLSAGSMVENPAPAGIVLALTGLPVGVLGWLRRRKSLQTAI